MILLTVSYRLSVVMRIAAAVLGGYVLSSMAAVLLAYLLPMSTADALMIGLLVSFAIYAAAVLWAFSARSALQTWLGLLVLLLACTVLMWMLHDGVAI